MFLYHLSADTKAVHYRELGVSCPEFVHHARIPSKYTCDGDNVNPPLNIEHIPEETKTLAIIADDPDAPGNTWVHWVKWNIPVTHHIREGHVPGADGINDFGSLGYGGPCPPKGSHRYFFKIYALDGTLNLHIGAKKIELEKAMAGHIIAFGELMGIYERKS